MTSSRPRAPPDLYVERMVLALHDRLGLSLMDRWPWINLSKPPSPTHWACVNRYQLCAGWEPVYWFTNDPDRVRSDNRRVLIPHTEKHQKLMAQGDNRVVSYGDGAYRLRGTHSLMSQKDGYRKTLSSAATVVRIRWSFGESLENWGCHRTRQCSQQTYLRWLSAF